MKHMAYTDTVRRIARSGWGRQHRTKNEADLALLENVDVTGAALLELVRIANSVATALAESSKPEPRVDPQPKEHHKKFPGVQFGDVLYTWDLDGGIEKNLVVEVHPEGYAKLTWDGSYAGWASDDHHQTIEEAIAAQLEVDLPYHKLRYERCLDAAKALQKGGDLSEFIAPINEEDEE